MASAGNAGLVQCPTLAIVPPGPARRSHSRPWRERPHCREGDRAQRGSRCPSRRSRSASSGGWGCSHRWRLVRSRARLSVWGLVAGRRLFEPRLVAPPIAMAWPSSSGSSRACAGYAARRRRCVARRPGAVAAGMPVLLLGDSASARGQLTGRVVRSFRRPRSSDFRAFTAHGYRSARGSPRLGEPHEST
jgi:hypothetical protein